MTEPVETVAPSMPLDQAVGLMRALRVHHLIVKDASKSPASAGPGQRVA